MAEATEETPLRDSQSLQSVADQGIYILIAAYNDTCVIDKKLQAKVEKIRGWLVVVACSYYNFLC